jgi:hypothetical protein
MTRVVLVGLAAVSMVFVVHLVSLALGFPIPASDSVISVGFVAVPVIAMGVLLLWAVRETQRSEDLVGSKKLTWYAVFACSGFIGAFLFLWSRTCAQPEITSVSHQSRGKAVDEGH